MVTVVSGARSDVGRVRANNEDSLLVGPRIWAVADGMGGHAAGEVASSLIVEGLAALTRGALRPVDLTSALHRINARIVRYGSDHPQAHGLGSTVAGLAAVTVDDAACWAAFNVGDSRVYRQDGDTLRRVTVDHTEVEELLQAKVITPAQARVHRGRHFLTRTLGQSRPPQVDLWLLPQRAGERFVVCSDGLSSELEDERIAAIAVAGAHGAGPAPQEAADALVEAALAAGGRDNVSVIVLDVRES
ncbi:MAG: serine/threonine-protein phosphatase [Nigerium sp.]|nr:serine/threonine-protein phosphatase [Nigerium sp.]